MIMFLAWNFPLKLSSSTIFRVAESLTSDRMMSPKKLLGSVSIDDGNGRENVSFKMNCRIFNLCRVYSNLLKMASIGEFPWS